MKKNKRRVRNQKKIKINETKVIYEQERYTSNKTDKDK